MKNKSLIDKSDFMECWACNGFGYTPTELKCKVCEGFGVWKEAHYIVIDNKNKIACDSDTGG